MRGVLVALVVVVVGCGGEVIELEDAACVARVDPAGTDRFCDGGALQPIAEGCIEGEQNADPAGNVWTCSDAGVWTFGR